MTIIMRPAARCSKSLAGFLTSGTWTPIVCESKQVSLRFFDRTKDRHNFQCVGNDQEAMELLACARKSDAAVALLDLACGIEDNAQDRGADESSVAEVDNDKDDAFVYSNVEAFMYFSGNVKIDVLVRSQKKYAINVV